MATSDVSSSANPVGGFIDWVTNLFGKAKHAKSEYPQAAPLTVAGEIRQKLKTDKDYISIQLRRMRIVYSRKGGNLYFGCVHSFIKLLDLSAGQAEFHVVSSPEKLRNLDGQNVNRVLTVDIPLLTSVPFRGGLTIQVGLFSMKAADLIQPYLSLLQTLSEKAGVGFVSKALGFAEPIKTGMNLLLGANQDVELEVGLQQGFNTPETGTYLLLGPSPQPVDTTGWQLSQTGELVDGKGQTVEGYPYLILTISQNSHREDFFTIPDIKEAHESMMKLIRDGKLSEVERDAFPHFRHVCLTSPDLIFEDAKAIIADQKKKLDEILVPTPVAAARKQAPQTWELEGLMPFNRDGLS